MKEPLDRGRNPVRHGVRQGISARQVHQALGRQVDIDRRRDGLAAWTLRRIPGLERGGRDNQMLAAPHRMNPVDQLQSMVFSMEHQVRRQDGAMDPTFAMNITDRFEHAFEHPRQVSAVQAARMALEDALGRVETITPPEGIDCADCSYETSPRALENIWHTDRRDSVRSVARVLPAPWPRGCSHLRYAGFSARRPGHHL